MGAWMAVDYVRYRDRVTQSSYGLEVETGGTESM